MQDRESNIRRIQAIQFKKDSIKKIIPDLKKDMLKKLNKNALWSYISIPDSKLESIAIRQMKEFIYYKLNYFVNYYCCEGLTEISQQDIDSIGTKLLTANAKKFQNIFNYLVYCGFFGPQDFSNKSICFWSGQEAKKRAYAETNYLSDGKIPAISVMFSITYILRKFLHGQYMEWITQLNSGISRLFSSFAYNDVAVFISSDKPSEKPGLTVGNHFWNAELPTLRELQKNNQIKRIMIYTYDYQANKWLLPFELGSAQSKSLPIRRRNFHPLDDPNRWFDSAAREEISYGKLINIIRQWKKKSHLTPTTPPSERKEVTLLKN